MKKMNKKTKKILLSVVSVLLARVRGIATQISG
jgi:hypothetical protein